MYLFVYGWSFNLTILVIMQLSAQTGLMNR
jgi:hypothetical protein